jgi:hypothetical protein
MNRFCFAGCVAAAVALTPALARATIRIDYSDLLPPVTFAVSGGQTGFPGFNKTTDLTKDQPALPLMETSGDVSANADLLFIRNLDPGLSYPDPQVSVDMTTSLPGGPGTRVARFGVEAEVDIYFEVDDEDLPPSEQPDTIKVGIVGSFFGTSNADAGVYIYDHTDMDSSPLASTDLDTAGAGTFDLLFDAEPYVEYEVRYLASAGACLASNPIETCSNTTPATYIAGIDPIVMVDPALTAAGDYVLTMSKGLAPSAPEPGTWIMAALGFAAIGSFAARRRMSAPARAPG